MPAKKKSSSWSSGRAPAWISDRERSRTSKARSASSRRSSSAARKPSRAAAGRSKARATPRSTARSTAARSTVRKQPAKKARKATATTRRTAPVRASSRRIYREPPQRTETAIERALYDEPAVPGGAIVEEAPAAFEEAEPAVAIAGVTPATLGPEPALAAEEPAAHEEPVKRPEDIPVVLAGLALAVSVFLPWYRVGSGDLTATGWETGAWGPLIFFLGIGAAALVLLRRLRVSVALPFAESIMLEGMGWLATLTAILKARFRPSIASLQMSTVLWVYLAVGAGIAVALLGGRISGKTPFVPVPGWHRGRAGKAGLALLVAIVAGSAAFGWMNSYTPGTGSGLTPTARGTAAPDVVRGLPACAKDFPVPQGFTPFNGIESKNALKTCVATYQTTASTADAGTQLAQSFQRGGWTFTRGTAGQATTFTITKPKCGSATVIPSADKKVYAVINVSVCQGS